MKGFEMKKLFTIALIVLLTNVPGVKADKRAPIQPLSTTSLSWFGTFGVGNPLPVDGVIYASEIDYPFQQVGFYSLSGNAFVGQAPALTHISGECFTGLSADDTPFHISATIQVDNSYSLPLFDTTDPVRSFNITVQGQSFTIKINTPAPVGCNILLESK